MSLYSSLTKDNTLSSMITLWIEIFSDRSNRNNFGCLVSLETLNKSSKRIESALITLLSNTQSTLKLYVKD